MGAVMAGAAVAAVALQAFGQVKGGSDAKKAADYNAAVARQEAEFQKKKTRHDVAFQKEEVERIIGKAKVAGGASGAELSQAILQSTLTEGAIDEQLIRTQGAINVWRAESQAGLLKEQGKDAFTGGLIGAGSTILTGASKWDYRKPGGESAITKKQRQEYAFRKAVK
jgi:hypothetical protein